MSSGTQEETISAPFIANSFNSYLKDIGVDAEKLDGPDELINFFNITQSFYAGFTAAINLASAIEKHELKQKIRQMIKEELFEFSQRNAKLTESVQKPQGG